MRRLAVALVVIAVVAGGAIAAAPALVSSRLAGAGIVERIGDITGGTVVLGGEPEFGLFPSAHVTLRNVAVTKPGDAGGDPLMTVDAMDATLAVWPLVMGRVEVRTLALTRPRLRLTASDLNGAREGSRLEAFGAAMSENADIRLHEIVVHDAAVTYEDGDARQTHPVATARLLLGREESDPTATISASVPWCGRMVALDAALDDPSAAFSGSPRDARLAVSFEPLPVPQGTAEQSGGAAAEGPLSPVRRVARLLGVPWLWSAVVGRLDVTGRFSVDETAVRVSDATFEIGGNVAEGRLRVGLGHDRPSLRRLLSSDEHDLCHYARMLDAASFAELRRLPARAGWLSRADVDFEASAETLGLGGLEFFGTSMSFISRDGRMNLDVDGRGGAGGAMSAALTIADEGAAGAADTSVRLAGSMTDVSVTNLGEIVWSRWGHPLIGVSQPPRGTGAMRFDLAARGETIGGVLDALDGSVVTDIRDGSLDGADIVATLEQLLDGDEVMIEGEGPFIPVAGRTFFDTLEARVDIGSGIARADRVRIAGDRYEIAFAGSGDLRRGAMQAQGTVSLYEAGDDARDRRIVELPFGVGGSIREPVVAPGVPRGAGRQDRTDDGRTVSDRLRVVREGDDE